jgi:hypothetical protein
MMGLDSGNSSLQLGPNNQMIKTITERTQNKGEEVKDKDNKQGRTNGIEG